MLAGRYKIGVCTIEMRQGKVNKFIDNKYNL